MTKGGLSDFWRFDFFPWFFFWMKIALVCHISITISATFMLTLDFELKFASCVPVKWKRRIPFLFKGFDMFFTALFYSLFFGGKALIFFITFKIRAERKHIKLPWDIEDAKKLGQVLDRYKDMYYFEVMSAVVIIYILWVDFHSIAFNHSDSEKQSLMMHFFISVLACKVSVNGSISNIDGNFHTLVAFCCSWLFRD